MDVRARTIGLAFGAAMAAAIGQAEQKMQTVELVCAPDAQAECAALQGALQNRLPKAQISLSSQDNINRHGVMLRVHLQVLRRAPDFLIARLAWKEPAAQNPVLTTGPEVEVATLDANLTPQAMSQLAESLLRVTPLPI